MKTLDEMIAVMEAAKEGKTIEVHDRNYNDPWSICDTTSLQWNWCACDYRVKPEVKDPQRLIGFKYPNEIVHCAYTSIANAALNSLDGVPPGSIKVQFIEITPEVREVLERSGILEA